MARKNPFPPEPDTKPDMRGSKVPKSRRPKESAPAPKSRRERSEAPTLPPPPGDGARASSLPPGDRVSDVRAVKGRLTAATVDEVTADLSRDPRHERDDDDQPKRRRNTPRS